MQPTSYDIQKDSRCGEESVTARLKCRGLNFLEMSGFEFLNLSLRAHFPTAAACSSALLSIIAFRSTGFSSRCLRVLLARIFGLTGSP